MFHVILIVNSNYFPKQVFNWDIVFCDMESVCLNTVCVYNFVL